jgi:hypothetical protein
MIFISTLTPFISILLSLPITNAVPALYANAPHHEVGLAKDMDPPTRRQFTGPGSGSPEVLRLAACFEDDDGYYLEFAIYHDVSHLSDFPGRIAKPARDAKRPLWEGRSVEAIDGGSIFRTNIEVGKPGELNSFAGTAVDTFVGMNCYSDAQHAVYHDGEHECRSIYYCKEGGPFGG